MGREHVGPIVFGARVDVHRVHFDQAGEAVDHVHVPIGPAVLAARDQLDGGVYPFYGPGPPFSLRNVFLWGERTDLAFTVHLVAQSPITHAVRFRGPVLFPLLRQRRLPVGVAVLYPGQRLLECPRAHIETDVGCCSELAAIIDELVRAEPVAFEAAPSYLCARGTAFPGAHPVAPVVIGDEVAPRPTQDADLHLLEQAQHIGTETPLVAEG